MGFLPSFLVLGLLIATAAAQDVGHREARRPPSNDAEWLVPIYDMPVYRDKAPGVIPPRLKKSKYASYPAEAMRKKVKGSVDLAAVVLPDGTVGDVRVLKSLDKRFGTDDAAVAAMKRWVFAPGTKDGKAVAVEVSVSMSFTLK